MISYVSKSVRGTIQNRNGAEGKEKGDTNEGFSNLKLPPLDLGDLTFYFLLGIVPERYKGRNGRSDVVVFI